MRNHHNKCHKCRGHQYGLFFMVLQSLVGQGLLVIEAYTVTQKHHTRWGFSG